MDDFNFIHYTQPVQEMHYHSSHQYFTKPSKLVILLKKCHFKFINNMLSFQLMIIVLTEAPLST